MPWFATLFGRDGLITALQTLAFAPAVAEHTLRLLASYQGKKVDPWCDEEPGKILHELRVGELAQRGAIPHTRYYGTVDATPLFLLLLARHASWTGELRLLEELGDSVERALEWIDRWGDSDGDGYVDYSSRVEKGLANQGWKDLGDAIVDADGRLARPPIALVEVQAYLYAAKLELAALFRRAGRAHEAEQLERQAGDLRARFGVDFWMEGARYPALALHDGGRPASVVASNAGHALWCGIVDSSRAAAIRRRLMATDMFSGWGIRTLSAAERRYNPMGYHLGAVWPHDTAVAAAGLRRYGFAEDAVRLCDGLLSAALHFEHRRSPELFCGFARRDFPQPVRYPVACHPQAWAAGAVPHLVETVLGIQADGFARQLRVVDPRLPPWVRWLRLQGLRVGAADVDLRFEQEEDGRCRVQAERTDGDLEVRVEHRRGPTSGSTAEAKDGA